MREIRFRSWETDEKKYTDFFGQGYVNILPTNGCIIEQSTGLHDKNGKEIYEGDIVRYDVSGNNFVVEYWIEDWACYVLVGIGGSGYEAMLSDYNTTNIEVIGNIHEGEYKCDK